MSKHIKLLETFNHIIQQSPKTAITSQSVTLQTTTSTPTSLSRAGLQQDADVTVAVQVFIVDCATHLVMATHVQLWCWWEGEGEGVTSGGKWIGKGRSQDNLKLRVARASTSVCQFSACVPPDPVKGQYMSIQIFSAVTREKGRGRGRREREELPPRTSTWWSLSSLRRQIIQIHPHHAGSDGRRPLARCCANLSAQLANSLPLPSVSPAAWSNIE